MPFSPHDLLRRFAHRHGISPLMLRARRHARGQGAHLRFRGDILSWERADATVTLDAGQPYTLLRILNLIEPTLRHAVTPVVDGRRVLDLRGPSRYRLPSGQLYWSPTPPEEADLIGGYLARGGVGPGTIALDAGAFAGEISIELAARVGPTGHVFALEPDPANRHIIERNIAELGLTNVTVLPYALSPRSGELYLHSGWGRGSMLTGIHPGITARSEVIPVTALSPADLFARIGAVPSFIKMDVEGAEVDIMPELAAYYAARPAQAVHLAVASYHQVAGRPASEHITPVLQAAGFRVETGHPTHLTTWASRG